MKEIMKAGLCVLCFGVFVAGCSSTGDIVEEETEFEEPVADTTDNDDDIELFPVDDACEPPCAFSRDALNDPAGPLAERLIFFAYDQSNIEAQYEKLLENHGKYLASYPDVKVRLEGHTDERGSREYNLALGEQRAKSVLQVLLLHGASGGNADAVTFGEELPLDAGHDESAWRQNRRVEIVYETK